MNSFSLVVSGTINAISAALDLLVVDITSPLSVQLSSTATSSEAVDIYESNLSTITSTDQARKIGTVTGQGPVELGGVRQRYLYAVRTAGSAGSPLLVEAQSSTSGVPGTTAWIQGGNSFGATGVLGTNDAFDLQVRANATTLLTLSSAGAVTGVSSAAQNISFTTGTTGTLTLTTGTTGAINLGADAGGAKTISIGTGAVANTITIGSTAGAASLTLNAGTGQILIGSTAQVRRSEFATGAAAQTVFIGSTTSTSSLTLSSGTGNIDIGTGAQARAVNVGTGAAAQTVTVGSTDTTSSLTLNAGTGNIDIGTSNGARTVKVATGAAVQTVNIGSTFGASAIDIESGTGGIQIGTTAAIARTISIGTAGGAVQTVNIGTGAVANPVTIGSTTGAAALTLQSGTGNVSILPGATGNLAFGSAGSFGNGTRVVFLANAVANPNANPVGGGILYVNAGALTYRGSGGTVTVLGAA